MSIATVVLGASGYVGGELLRLLHTHPDFTLSAALSQNFAGKPIGNLFPHLGAAYPDDVFAPVDDWATGVDSGSNIAFFSAAPHGASAGVVLNVLGEAAQRNLNVRIVDVSADFRLADAQLFETVYGTAHPAPSLFADFTCAVPEHLATSPTAHVAHPGCFATATLLAALPAVRAGVIDRHLFVHGVTGSTGSGRRPGPGTHYPERHGNLYAYKPLQHRHSPEVEHLLAAAGAPACDVHFVPHSGPFARGIHVTLQARLARGAAEQAVRRAYADVYGDSTFVHVVDGPPRLKDVVASNHAQIAIAVDQSSVTVMCVIDNLVKGAAGGAWQWMNRLWSLPEDRGLTALSPGWT